MIKGPTGLGMPDDRGWRKGWRSRASAGNGKRCDKGDVGEKVLQQQARVREALLQQSAVRSFWNRGKDLEPPTCILNPRTRGDSQSMY